MQSTMYFKAPIIIHYVGTSTVFENHRKKSHSTLRATFTFWVEQLKCQKWSIWRVLKTWSLLSNRVNRQVNFYDGTKIGGKRQFSWLFLARKLFFFLPIFFKSITKFHMEFYASSTFFQQVTNEDVKVCNDYMQYQNRKPVLLLQLI